MTEIMTVESKVEAYNGEKLSKADMKMIKEHIAKGASDVELRMFLAICQRTGLDPFSRQIYLIPRWDSALGKEVRTTQVGIDGFRSAAERSGGYAGSEDPEYGDIEERNWFKKDSKEPAGNYKAPASARVTVYKIVQGVRCPFTATAKFEEFYPGDKNGFMWRTKPHVMLSKCAEAQALRKAFPMVLSGIYVPEETQTAPEEDTDQSSNFDTAVALLKKLKSQKTLTEYLEKIKGSDKYSDEEKVEIAMVVEERILELKPKK